MPSMSGRRVVAVVPNLFFATRLAATAAQVGVALETVAAAEAVAAIRRLPTDLVVLDLVAADDPLAVARALKSDASTRAIPIVGFYPHVKGTLRAAALAAGVDHVLPRSAFSARLASLLAGDGQR
jgi:CheY-like chemotaxis protein